MERSFKRNRSFPIIVDKNSTRSTTIRISIFQITYVTYLSGFLDGNTLPFPIRFTYRRSYNVALTYVYVSTTSGVRVLFRASFI